MKNPPVTSKLPPTNPLSAGLFKLRTFLTSQVARWLVLGLFVLQAVFLAFATRVGTPPDEVNHIQFIQFYAHHSLSPIFDEQTPTYNLGDKTREVDYLYHYSMSLVARALPASEHTEVVVIRLFSVVFALLTLLVLAKVFNRLGISYGATTGALALMTNLPMVLMLSSAVNNDVLVWLGTAIGLLLILRLWQQPRFIDLVWLINLSIVGGLVKRTFLPLGMVLGVISLLVLIRHYRHVMSSVRWRSVPVVLTLLVLVVSTGLFVERVGGNVTRYGHIVVTCDEVHGEDACYDFWDNIRKRNLATQAPEAPVPLGEFVYRWFGESFANVVDIQTQGWRHQVKPARWLTPVLVWLLLISLAYGLIHDGKRFRADQLARWRLYVLSVGLYFVIVQLVVNLGNYRTYHVFGIALNGRYILPTLLPLIGLGWFYWATLLRRWPRLQVVLAVGIVVCTIAGSGLLMMLHNPQLRLG